MADGTFSTRAVVVIVVVTATSFLLGIGLILFGPEMEVPTAGSDAYSRSALGHRAFLEVLDSVEIRTLVSRHDSAQRAGQRGLLVIAEPDESLIGDAHGSELRAAVQRPPGPILIVLPKRVGYQDPNRSGFVRHVGLKTLRQVEQVLSWTGAQGSVERFEHTHNWTSSIGIPGIPELDNPQLIQSDRIRALIRCDEGILLGAIRDDAERPVWILSDPDLIATHGIVRGDNGFMVVSLVASLVPDNGVVVFDATLHGLASEPNIFKSLFEFPLVLVIAQLGLLLGAFFWATIKRFGPPGVEEAGITPGKTYLINNTAELLLFGRHSAHGLARYYQTVVQTISQRLHAPRDLTGRALIDWLDAQGERRGLETRLGDIDDAVVMLSQGGRHDRRILSTALELHHWKTDIVHEPGRHTDAE